ncbi:MAG: polyprenyl synthetase family protein [Chloroflexi bacterium]|nr:polyprenyl synthetase family protein [Chloroflexota bacterium]
MAAQKFDFLLAELDKRKKLVKDYLLQDPYADSFRPAHIRDAAFSYLKGGGKSLRAAVLLLSCGAVGGDEMIALPAAAGVEIYHTWTLVHDDVIDKDDRRRGAPTVHTEFTQRAAADLGWTGEDAAHYGLSIAMLVGDLQQGWSWHLFFDLFNKNKVHPALVLSLVTELSTYVHTTLIEGETLDIQFSRSPVGSLSEQAVTDMLWKKTGVLYEFAGRAGAAIGLGDADANIPVARAIATFCSRCGTAFQIQDDILGILGDESQLGKPVGSDIREGKNTLLTLRALSSASSAQRAFMLGVLGNSDASPQAIAEVTQMMRDLKVIDYAQQTARQHIDHALESLHILPDSQYKQLLQLWAEYLVERQF